MPRRHSLARVIALAATAVAAVALFALSLSGLAGLDGRLAAAVSAEQSPASIQVSDDEHRSADGRDCPFRERREPAVRVRS